MIILSGTLHHLTYQNPDNHYTVARIKLPKISEPVTVVGHLAGVIEGENLEVSGTWSAHPKYGDQFKVETYKVMLPESTSGIRRYLGSGIIAGIGKSLADKIVDHFQEQTLEIIENDPDQLLKIQGIGKHKKQAIEQAWNQHHAVRRVMQFLQENSVSVHHAAMILKIYGTKAMELLQANPYLIVRDLPEIGFTIADRIALKTGTDREDENRLQACLIHSLISAEQDGHVYLFKTQLFQAAARVAGVSASVFEPALTLLKDSGEIKICDDEADTQVYLKRLFTAESGIANRIRAILSMPKKTFQVSEEEILDNILNRLAVKLSEEQLKVVAGVMEERIVVITGGPGTGKTTLIRALCELFSLRHLKVVLSAPTGRAARRLSQVTGKKASTLHKLLGFDHENQTFERHRANPLDLDLFIVDEASMVDTILMYRLFDALPVTAGVIIVGDTFQLPSVGPGNVLSDIIDSGRVKVFSLTKIFRQAAQSPIIMYAHSIRNGEMPQFEKASSGELSEFYFIENTHPEKVVSTILELCSTRIPKAFPHIDEIQVLTPMHRGEAGTINLNQQLQQILNPKKGGIEAGGVTFKPNDKVMHLKNNYEKDVFNGDIGTVTEVIPSRNKLLVDYDGRIVEYDILELDELSLAYTISVHKSQGSEYSAVIIALTTAHFPLLQRNLLYTAMTRGKHLVIVVGSSRALEIALNNDKTAHRLTGLKQKLSER